MTSDIRPPSAEPPDEAPSEAVPPPVAEAWEAVLSAALVGSARRAVPPVAVELVGRLTGGPSDPNRRSSPRSSLTEERQFEAVEAGGDPAAVVLSAAALLSSYRRAGRLPGAAPRTLPAPAAADDRPPCSGAAVEVLELILSGEVPIPGGAAPLAGEWLAGAARAGHRLPARLLPRLLDLGSSSAELQPALQAVIGPRGRWLARHHDRWAWAAAEPIRFGEPDDARRTADDDAVDDDGRTASDEATRRYATAGRADRLAMLEAVRSSDPARGRDLLASTWARDPAADRAALVGLLAVSLSDDDEPFLEAALDDRSGNVRQIAAELLARLPNSRRSARLADRLRLLVIVEPAPGAGSPTARAKPALPGSGRRNSGTPVAGQLTIGRPEPPDAAARRDGITDAGPAGMGVSAWWAAQIAAGAPLSFWEGEVGLSPAEVVEQATGIPELLGGLEYAVVAQVGAGSADPAWAQAMLAARPTPAVLGALPADLAAVELTGLVARGLAPRQNVSDLFAACPGPWPAALTEAVLDRYRQLGARAAIEAPATLPVLAARLDPAALPLVETWLFTLAGEPALRRRVQSLAHALSLRAVIHREFPL